MSIETHTTDNDILHINIQGEMTIYCANDQHEKILAESQKPDHQGIDIDLSNVNEIDTSGVQILLALKETLKKQEKPFNIVKLSTAVQNVLTIYDIYTDLGLEIETQ